MKKKELKNFALIIAFTIFHFVAQIVGVREYNLKKMKDDFDELLDEGDEDDDGILDAEDQDFVDETKAEEYAVEETEKENEKIKKTETDTTISETGGGTIENIARAFKSHEGWVPPGGRLPRGSASYRNNNPGNLKYVGQAGAEGSDERGFAIFSSYDLGWAALLRDISIKLRRTPDHSILSLITEYEGGDPLNPPGNDLAYAKAVAKQLSEATGKLISIDTKIKNV